MSRESEFTRFLNVDRGNQSMSHVAIIAVGATVLIGVLRIGASVLDETKDRTVTILTGNLASSGQLNVDSTNSPDQPDTDRVTAGKPQVSTSDLDDQLQNDQEGSPTITSSSLASQTARAFQKMQSAGAAAPAAGTVISTPSDPAIPSTGEPITGQQPLPTQPSAEPAEPTEPTVATPSSEDPGVGEPSKKKSPARKKPRNGKDATERESDEDADSQDRSDTDPFQSQDQSSQGMTSPGLSGGSAGGSGTTPFPGFTGNNGVMGVGQTGFPQGLPNANSGNFNGLGYGGNSPYQPDSTHPLYGRELLGEKRSARNNSADDSSESATTQDSGAETKNTSKSQRRSLRQISNLKPKDGHEDSADKKLNPVFDAMMTLEGPPSADKLKSEANDVRFTSSSAIEITGVDRSDTEIPRLLIVCHKPFRQIQIRGNDHHLAFNAPQPEQRRSIPLDAEMLQPGTELEILGIEAESVELLTYHIPSDGSESADTLQNVPPGEEKMQPEPARAPVSPRVDPMFTKSVELMEQ